MTTPDKSVDAFLEELNQEFGKKPKASEVNAEAKKRNREWHERNQPLGKGAASFARAQLEKKAFENYYDWDQHRILTLEASASEELDATLPDLEWYPEAQVTYIVRQLCACCNNTVEFIGSQYIRFRGRLRKFHVLGGEVRSMHPTVLQRIDRVDPNLLAFGLPDGNPLPDLIEELNETVQRCPGCINVERMALDLWVKAVQPDVQGDLLAEPSAERERLSSGQLRAFVQHAFGERFRKPANTEIDIDIEENE
jgi:hypothetical protein